MTIPTSDQQQKAEALLALHADGSFLILPNVWNPIGGRVLQSMGYQAVATASSSIAASLGYEDGEKIQRSTLVDILERIARSVDVPVTADIETGYGKTISALEDTVRAVISAGIVGINIEDGVEEGGPLLSIEDQCARISAVRHLSTRLGLHLVINARIDSYLSSSFSDVSDATEDAISRAHAYAKAGADSVYPIGPSDEETVRTLRERIDTPINILGSPDGAALSTLEGLGINRVSFGPLVFRACLKKFTDIAGALKDHSDSSGMADRLSEAEAAVYLRDGLELQTE